jgi:hypothetical protein
MQEMVTVVCILNPEFAHNAVAQSRDCAALLRNLEIGTQFEDSENALRNLEIAHIPKLHGTCISFYYSCESSNSMCIRQSNDEFLHVERGVW